MNKSIIGFAGNGHLMDTSAAAAHIKGFEKVKYAPAKTGDSLTDLHECDIVYICPDRPSNTSPQKMVDLVLPHLKEDTILVILCQVEPGFTRKVKWPKEQLYYQVETLKVTDKTMDRALNPERIILGTDVWEIPDILSEFLISFNCPILKMSYESAELAKIAINYYLAKQIEASNTLSQIAEKIGANWNDIIPALQTDKRIGEFAYLKPGELGQHLRRDVDYVAKF